MSKGPKDEELEVPVDRDPDELEDDAMEDWVRTEYQHGSD